jgi:hypothetical protein
MGTGSVPEWVAGAEPPPAALGFAAPILGSGSYPAANDAAGEGAPGAAAELVHQVGRHRGIVQPAQPLLQSGKPPHEFSGTPAGK